MTAILVLSVMGSALATEPDPDSGLIDGHKTTICHVTNSATNPFVEITIDIAAWHSEGSEGHSPDHHLNKKTGDNDFELGLATECDGAEEPPPNE
jgi:hypothetical protein